MREMVGRTLGKLVGREKQVEAALAALRSPGGLLLVSGEAGVGKTSLITEVVSVGSAMRRPVVWVRPEKIARPGPFAFLLELLQEVMDDYPKIAGEAGAEGLIQSLLGVTPTANPAAIPQIAARIRGIIAALGSSPILVLEDLQWSDNASQAVILRLARIARDDGYLVIASYRSDELFEDELAQFLESVSREHLAIEIALSRLSQEDAATLARRLLGESAQNKAEWIASLSEGIPFFIEEFAVVGVADGEIPQSITRVALARWQTLGPVARQIVAAAALLSGPIDSRILAVACEVDDSTVSRALTEGVKAGVLEDRDDTLAFRHALTRETLRGSLVSVEKQELHGRLARAIEEKYAAEVDLHSKSLAFHWYEARDLTRAKFWALRAAQRALALAATTDAKSAFELAVACSKGVAPPEALLGLAEVQIRDGRTETAHELLQRASEGFRKEGRDAEAAEALARLAWVRSVDQIGDPIEAIDSALALVPDGGARELDPRIPLVAQKGQLLLQALGKVEEAKPYLREAAEAAALTGNHVVRAECLDGLAWAAEFERQAQQADELAAEACREAVLSEKSETIGRTHNNSALLLLSHGQPQEAVDLLARTRQLLERSFGRGGVAVIELTEALAHWKMGMPSQVYRLVARREVGWAHWRGYTRILQVWSSLHAGEFGRAESIVAQYWADLGISRSAIDESDQHSELAEALVCDLIVRLEKSDPACIREAQAVLRINRMGPPEDFLLAISLASRAAILANDSDAENLLEEMQKELDRYPSPYYSAHCSELMALLVRYRDTDAAAHLLRESARLFDIAQNSVDRARALRLAASLSSPELDTDRVALLKTARDLARESGSQLELAKIEADLRALGVRPRAGRPRKSERLRGSLSPREEEIAVMVAAGATNAEIGRRLFLSERTVQDHITNSLKKLGVSGRASLAAWAAKQGLV